MTTASTSGSERLLNAISATLSAAHTVASTLAIVFLVTVVILDHYNDSSPELRDRQAFDTNAFDSNAFDNHFDVFSDGRQNPPSVLGTVEDGQIWQPDQEQADQTLVSLDTNLVARNSLPGDCNAAPLVPGGKTQQRTDEPRKLASTGLNAIDYISQLFRIDSAEPATTLASAN